MEKAKALFHSLKLSELVEKYKAIGFNWEIRKGTMEQRYARIKGKYEEFFNKQFKEIDNIKNKDLVGFLDSLSLMNSLNNLLKDLDEIDVFMEFLIPYSHEKRIDYLLCFKCTILILEFGYFDFQHNSKKYMEFYHQKLIQVMQYEKLLQNLISSKVKTIPYVILYSPEINEAREPIANKNSNRIIELASLIKGLYLKDTTATEELKRLIN